MHFGFISCVQHDGRGAICVMRVRRSEARAFRESAPKVQTGLLEVFENPISSLSVEDSEVVRIPSVGTFEEDRIHAQFL